MSATLTAAAHTARVARSGSSIGVLPAMTCIGIIAGVSAGLWIGVARAVVLIAAQF